MISIYYSDNDIVVCEKIYGVSSQKSGGDNMVDMLSCQLSSEIFPVHRLDDFCKKLQKCRSTVKRYF